ncbi:UDP-2,3-diacylglucosamine diphosphatase [Maribellus maritimus]|uniref:UDP-2,3-diacylglucosamine diphosphatase n=1 Tax=Maribellus maritimus TaxID=2870838 RepID=UPI001EEAF120|nr:UDP-2,3-diacylglucosamine diphosphatase [Maribellus maritimus]MCG6189657.1 UDP-2,3-diacylglucosamine diphosphatase [Maribellus maritimus]
MIKIISCIVLETRKLEVSVISDLHLATHGSKPKKVLKYLKSIQPKLLVLNGDIIDSWRFSRNYFPKPHLKVVRYLIKMMEKGVQIIYVSGNHDEFLRKMVPTQIGNLKIVNQYIFESGDTKTWIFHGDIFDKIIHKTKWLAKLGAAVYGFVSIVNNEINKLLKLFGKQEVQFYNGIKKRWIKDDHLSGFEQQVAHLALLKGYQTVICGHTHVPIEKHIVLNGKRLQYINCGDWVENFTAAEFYHDKWHLFHYNGFDDESQSDEQDFPEPQQIYMSLVKELGA